jgi:hypothetical protein
MSAQRFSRPLTPLEAFLDQFSRACLPFVTAQTCALFAFVVFIAFCGIKYRRTGTFPSVDDCLRVALTTVTLLTGVIAVLGLLLPTPPAPPELSEAVLRAMGLTGAVALFSYAGKTLHQVFKKE